MAFPIPESALDQHIAILGKTGSGKTFTAKGITEHLLTRKRQVCVLDPTSAWWGLRLGADGKSRGFNVVLLGGKHADIPLAERSGAAVGRLVTQQRASVVIDTSGMTVGEYTRWFIDFAQTIYTTIRDPLHLVIDEAHYFMPQGKAPDVDAGRMLHAGNRLMSGGRSLGIRGVMITQRPAKFHKDSLTCADTLIAMRLIAPQDRAAVKEWVDGAGDADQGREVLNSLAQLQRGEGWVWYPEGGHLQRVKFPNIATYDSSATPKHGEGSAPTVRQIDLAEVKNALADAVKEAEANDPALLRKQIAELKKAAGKSPPVDTERVKALEDELERQRIVLRGAASDIATLNDRMRRIAELAGHAPAVVPRPDVRRTPPIAKPPAQRPAPTMSPRPQSDVKLSKCERAILTVLAQHGRCEQGKLAILAGYAPSGGGGRRVHLLRRHPIAPFYRFG